MNSYEGPNLTVEQVRRIVARQFPDLAGADVAFVGNGGDFDVFRVDQRWMFRFPKGPDSEQNLLREMALLDAIGPQLPVDFPRYVLHGQPSDIFSHQFGAYETLSGMIAAYTDLPSNWLIGAEALGRLVSILHQVDVTRLQALGVPSIEAETPAVSREAALQDLANAQCLDPALHRVCVEIFRDESRIPAAYDGPPHLVHTDLGPAHLLVSAASGALMGVIDWTDASLGDPAWDFAMPWAWRGDRFVEAMLRHYEPLADPGMWQRIRYCGVCVAVAFACGVSGNAHQYRESGHRWLRRIFSMQSS